MSEAKYRVHRQAEWPRAFHTLAGAIAYIRDWCGLWYILEERDGEEWKTLISLADSKSRSASFNDPGVEDRT